MIIAEKRIPIEQCVERKVYKLHARNIKIGVYVREPKYGGGEWFHFYGIRTKFGSRFIDAENHWDGKEFASCCPLEEIGELPADINIEDREALFNWLDAKEKEVWPTDEAWHEWKEKLWEEEMSARRAQRNQNPNRKDNG
jgi:hypothetical protein